VAGGDESAPATTYNDTRKSAGSILFYFDFLCKLFLFRPHGHARNKYQMIFGHRVKVLLEVGVDGSYKKFEVMVLKNKIKIKINNKK